MKAYSAERKEALVRRMMAPENALVSALARETGITEQTLYMWRRPAKGQGLAVPGDGKNPEGWSSEDKFAVVLEAAPLNAAELAEYCRRRKLLPPVTDEWVRRLLRREGLSAQRVRTWKTSTDPDFDRKKNASGRFIGAARRAAR